MELFNGKNGLFFGILISLCFSLPAWGLMVTHGPIVGGVTSESARILARTDMQANVSFELDTDEAFGNPISTESVAAEIDKDYFVIVDVKGLLPDTKYYYRAVLDDMPQEEIREFMTFPLEGTPSTFSFAFGSCQQAPGDPKSYIGRVFPLIVEEGDRFFIHLGDWHYPDSLYKGPGTFSEDYGLVQASYREKYDPDYPMNELLKIAPVDYVYDDHDYTANNSDMTFPGRENALRGYQDMFPHYPLPNPDHGLWHKFSYGNADFFVMDTRTQRRPNIEAFQEMSDGRLVFQPDQDHLMLQGDSTISGELQMDWLIRELRESKATWKFICSTVAFNPGQRAALEMPLLFQGVPGFDPLQTPEGKIPPADIAIAASDSWNGFPASIQRLVREVSNAKVENVMVLSGDSHTAAIDDGAHSLFPELMAGGLDRTNSKVVAFMELFGVNVWNKGGQTLTSNNFNSHYGRVTVSGDEYVKFEIIDEFGELIASYTQSSGHLVSRLSLTVAPEFQDFGEVEVGKIASMPILMINTGAEPIEISRITSSNSAFALPPSIKTPFLIPTGILMNLGLLFQPETAGEQDALITIESSDPESPFTIYVSGRAKPAVDGSSPAFTMSLDPGLNMISLPLKPDVPYTARSLVEELSATVLIQYDRDVKNFVAFTAVSPGDGFAIEGGKGYIVNVSEGGDFTFTGTAWTNNVKAAPMANQNNSAWAFVVSGLAIDDKAVNTGDYILTVTNTRTGARATDLIDRNGYFAAVWADLDFNPVVQAGDRLEILITANDGRIVAGPFTQTVTPDAIRKAMLDILPKLGNIIPGYSALLQNYPNPFNPETWIPYNLKDASPVTIVIYNAAGQSIRTIDLGYKDAGIYVSKSESAYWDGRNEMGEEVASGIYFYKISAGNFSGVGKMTMTK